MSIPSERETKRDLELPEYGLGSISVKDARMLTQAVRKLHGEEIREDEDWFAEWVRFYQANKEKEEQGGEVL